MGLQKSLYQFFKAYTNNATKSKNQYYARSISDTKNAIKKSLTEKTEVPIDKYIDEVNEILEMRGSSWRTIALKFLENFNRVFLVKYPDQLYKLDYFETKIRIEKTLLNTHRRVTGLDILLECLIDAKDNNLIMLAFGPNYNLELEASILKGLLTEFHIDNRLPVEKIKKLTYWELYCRS